MESVEPGAGEDALGNVLNPSFTRLVTLFNVIPKNDSIAMTMERRREDFSKVGKTKKTQKILSWNLKESLHL